MSNFNRRHFLYFASSTLATLGINQLTFLQQAQNYGQVLAKSTSRKLALLIGINQYLHEPLAGCLNDIELQRHLLIHRFGFNPKDIYILTDKQATRQGILEAFEEHLIKQAQPGDVVAYHYSGHGSRIFDPQPIMRTNQHPRHPKELNGTFVPIDAELPPGYPEAGGSVIDIMGHTLFLLMSALKTENVTVTLDSCFAGGATRDAVVRTRPGGKNILVSPLEKAYQQQWLKRLKMSPEEFVKGYRKGVAKGVVLAATQHQQLAREVNINGFHAGVFTYLLTNYLWQEDKTVDEIIAAIRPQIPRTFKQIPTYEVKPDSNYQNQKLFFIKNPAPIGNAVITEVKGNKVKLWLGGVEDLGTIDVGTIFNVVGGNGKVKIVDRIGLVGEATAEGNVETGMILSQI
ncbi:MAG: caspase family protein [Sphaerospermopsis sp. SIO1G1]|nr:caspase family protein [Sphaerospermopsis sp. SIO1G1]